MNAIRPGSPPPFGPCPHERLPLGAAPPSKASPGFMRPPDDVVPAGPDRSHADMINDLRSEETLGHEYALAGELHA